MFPIGDDDSALNDKGIINYLLIGFSVLIFFYENSLGASTQALQNFVNNYGIIPAQIANGEDYHTFLTSLFLHGSWAHLIGNMLFLWVFGDNLENLFGHLRYLIFYLATGLVASAAQIWLSLGTADALIPTVGASGAISGVLGAYIVLFGMNQVRVFFGYRTLILPAWIIIGLWAIQQFIATFASIVQTGHTSPQSGIAYAAHIGGFIAGAILAFVIRTIGMRREPADYRP